MYNCDGNVYNQLLLLYFKSKEGVDVGANEWQRTGQCMAANVSRDAAKLPYGFSSRYHRRRHSSVCV